MIIEIDIRIPCAGYDDSESEGRDLKQIDDCRQSSPISHYFFISFEGLLLRCCFSFFRHLPSHLIRGGRGAFE